MQKYTHAIIRKYTNCRRCGLVVVGGEESQPIAGDEVGGRHGLRQIAVEILEKTVMLVNFRGNPRKKGFIYAGNCGVPPGAGAWQQGLHS